MRGPPDVDFPPHMLFFVSTDPCESTGVVAAIGERVRLGGTGQLDDRFRAGPGRLSGEAAANEASREERDLSLHGRRPEPARALRLQAPPHLAQRPTRPPVSRRGQALRLHGQLARHEAPRHPPPVRATRPERRLGVRPFPLHRRHRGRHHPRQILRRRSLQPRPGQTFHEHRLRPVWPPEHGLMDHLRPRQREPEPPRLRLALPRLPDSGVAKLAERFPPRHLSGQLHQHRVHRHRPPHRAHPQSLRHAPSPARPTRPPPAAQRSPRRPAPARGSARRAPVVAAPRVLPAPLSPRPRNDRRSHGRSCDRDGRPAPVPAAR